MKPQSLNPLPKRRSKTIWPKERERETARKRLERQYPGRLNGKTAWETPLGLLGQLKKGEEKP